MIKNNKEKTIQQQKGLPTLSADLNNNYITISKYTEDCTLDTLLSGHPLAKNIHYYFEFICEYVGVLDI